MLVEVLARRRLALDAQLSSCCLKRHQAKAQGGVPGSGWRRQGLRIGGSRMASGRTAIGGRPAPGNAGAARDGRGSLAAQPGALWRAKGGVWEHHMDLRGRATGGCTNDCLLASGCLRSLVQPRVGVVDAALVGFASQRAHASLKVHSEASAAVSDRLTLPRLHLQRPNSRFCRERGQDMIVVMATDF